MKDPLDRYYTPDPLAMLLCAVLERKGYNPRRVLEPSCGGGAFVRAIRSVWPDAHVTGVDVDPDATGLQSCHARYVEQFESYKSSAPYDLVVGNPPFSDDDRARAHVDKARLLSSSVAFILPIHILGKWQPYLKGLHFFSPIVPRPWPASVRETALFVWDADTIDTTLIQIPRWDT